MIRIENGQIIIPNNYAKPDWDCFKYDRKRDIYKSFVSQKLITMVNEKYNTNICYNHKEFKFGYGFKVKPWDHQIKAIEKSIDQESFAFFMEQGTGKTKVVIDEVSILANRGEVENVIIICPKSLMRTWEKEIHEYSYEANTVRWKKKPKPKILYALNYYIINIDAINTKMGFAWISTYVSDKTYVVLDESTLIKNISAKRTQKAIALARSCRYRRILSGTPIAKNSIDLYSQMLFVSDYIWGNASYYSFRGTFAIMGGYLNKQVVGYKNEKRLAELLSPLCFRVVKEDCLDIPPKIYETREIELSTEQKKKYKELLKDINKKELSKDNKNWYTNTMVILGKLHQVCGGFLREDNEVTVIQNSKLAEVTQILEQSRGQTLIWCKYVAEIEHLEKELKKDNYKVGTIYGKIKLADRERTIEDFENSKLDVVILQYQTGGVGLTLNKANQVIYYSNDYSYAMRVQSEDRCHRGGQTKSVTYIDLVCRGTVDEKIINILKNKKSLADLVLESVNNDEDFLDDILW